MAILGIGKKKPQYQRSIDQMREKQRLEEYYNKKRHNREVQERLISMRAYKGKEQQKKELEAATKTHLLKMQELSRNRAETQALAEIAKQRAAGAEQRNKLIKARRERLTHIKSFVPRLPQLGNIGAAFGSGGQPPAGGRRHSKVYVQTSYGWRALHYGENPGNQQLFRRTAKGYRPIKGDVQEYRTPEPMKRRGILDDENTPIFGGTPAPVKPKDTFFDF